MKNYKSLNRNKSIKRRKKAKPKVFKIISLRQINIKKPIIFIELAIIVYISFMLVLNNFDFDSTKNNLPLENLTSSTDLKNLLDTSVLTSKDIELLNNNLQTTADFNPSILSYTEAELKNKNKILLDNYTIDPKTGVNLDLFDFNKFINSSFTLDIQNKKEPKILIFHTHGSETYADSNSLEEGVLGLGALLKKEFEEVYGIPTLHITERFDIVDGQTQILGSYERMNKYIKKVIDDNPSIEVVLDIHRDGLPEDVKHVVTVDGKQTSPIMFVNGLTSLKSGSSFVPIPDLVNNNLEENLAFSFKTKTIGKSNYPTLFKNIYLHAYRYSLHFKGKSLLIEVGAQTNTWEESKNSIKPLAKTIVDALK